MRAACVNALKGATFISTRVTKMPLMRNKCVNALKGATFISTGESEDDESDNVK